MTGTHNQGFDRLIKAVGEISKQSKEKFLVQTGNSNVQPKNCDYRKFFTPTELEKKIQESSLVITHAGAGSIINSLKNKKHTIVVPREKKFNEHVNDHQIDLAQALYKEKKVVMCRDVKKLQEKINKAKTLITAKQNNKEIMKEIELFLG